MADKKSDIFGKQTATEARQAQQDKADARAEAAEERRVDAAHAQHNKNVEAHKAADKDALTFTANKDRIYTRTYPSGKVPIGQWGLAVWTRDANPTEHPCFLDNQGDWWWATTTNQNGVNPAVEKTQEPVGWRMF